MLYLPDVTLVIAETRAHDLAKHAINDVLSRVKFREVIIYSDKNIGVPDARYIRVSDWGNKLASGRFYYMKAALEAKTSHALLMEWDAGINKPECWSNDFLNYDFIGAPWPGRGHSRVRNGNNVGNGGFMLLSHRMIQYLGKSKLVIETDYHLACDHRPRIEQETGFKWAPDFIAEKFSFEGWDYGMPNLRTAPFSFGYHGVFNWNVMHTPEEVFERAKLVNANPFIREAKLNLLIASAPWIGPALGIKPPVKMMRGASRGPSAIEIARERRGQLANLAKARVRYRQGEKA